MKTRFFSAVGNFSLSEACCIFFFMNRSGYPFSPKVILMKFNSSFSVSSEQIRYARCVKQRTRFRFCAMGTKLSKLMYWPLHVCFLKTLLFSDPSSLHSRETSKKANFWLSSNSCLNLMLLWPMLNRARRSSVLTSFDEMRSIYRQRITYRNQDSQLQSLISLVRAYS